ncbi:MULTISPECIES: (d)CMP kinase [Mobiluncus]|uniref:Cytidylate kinase n=2 Tax=Mobiluncus TaxID=2050 RepID=E6M312_9ACTO|nr:MULTISPECIES: (d)CMP kinase [Mobiluncus]EFU82348.1 cytidylate kinase [Mobiluncus holmesii ATCC 35242]MCU9987476.1 (d)CMP kinase [Mobiluncus curtisii]MCV0000449.1 (d)CMP kinase [Mobiluncus curtisii]NMW49505.1 (d)CMP kinase [Mobiluncus curtisii]NMW87803.1 (d)CMP kinase [Mobiluncus curtisii]
MEYANYEALREKILGRGVVVAIDGPSGSGKSTISRNVAAALDLGYLDTGAMYRAAAWGVEHRGVDLNDSAAIAAAVREMKLTVNAVPHAPRIFVDGIDVMHVIRTDHINTIVSSVSSVPEVRTVLIALQRDIIAQARQSTRGIVVEGRDITTVVAPDAQVRILLTASAETRVSRRALEDQGDARSETLDRERALVLDRDARDAKVTSFHTAADGVTTLDSTDLSVSQTLDTVMRLIDQATN